jgi:hypothetical protein
MLFIDRRNWQRPHRVCFEQAESGGPDVHGHHRAHSDGSRPVTDGRAVERHQPFCAAPDGADASPFVELNDRAEHR